MKTIVASIAFALAVAACGGSKAEQKTDAEKKM